MCILCHILHPILLYCNSKKVFKISNKIKKILRSVKSIWYHQYPQRLMQYRRFYRIIFYVYMFVCVCLHNHHYRNIVFMGPGHGHREQHLSRDRHRRSKCVYNVATVDAIAVCASIIGLGV